jgi:hypothetical protein
MYSQQSPVVFKQDKKHSWRKPFLIATETAAMTGGLIGLNYLWYEQYARTPFHIFNDNNLWLGMDKMGHCFSAYAIGALNTDVIRWAGGSKKTSVWLGGTSGLVFLSAIEMFDGFSEHWGFSWGDMIANTGGTALFISQQLLWNEQRFQMKYSFWPSNYSKDRPDLLGDNFAQQLMKDYNGQTYWLSANVWSFLPNRESSSFPRWFNISIGYGANGLLGGDKNPAEFSHVQRYHQFFLSVDVDLTKIPTKSKVLKTVFRTFNMIKFPAPAFEFNTSSDNPVRFHWLYF